MIHVFQFEKPEPPGKRCRRLKVLLIGLQTAVVLIVSGCSQPAVAQQQTPSPIVKATLTATEQAQLAQLESRPIKLPKVTADGQCPADSLTRISPYRNSSNSDPLYVYGSGRVFVEGGPRTATAKNSFYDVTYFADPTVTGVVLVRIQPLDGRLNAFFVGDWAAGPVVGTDTIGGKSVELRAELALPSDRAPSNSNAAPGWRIWSIRQGIANDSGSCIGFQFDTQAGSEVVVVQG